MCNKDKQAKAFLVYYDNEVVVCRLPDEEAGRLFKSLFPYGRESIIPDFENSPALAMAFDIIKMAIDRDKEKYAEKCEKNRQNIKKRWNKSDATVYERIQPDTNDTNNNSNTNNNNNTNNNIKKDNKEKDKRERACFTPPTVTDVKAYCQEKGYTMDPERFIDFYESKGWMIGKNKMKDWKAAVRNWVKRDETKVQQAKTKNKFNNFDQRSYNYKDLERQLLG